MAAVAYNLKKLIKWKGPNVETAVMAMKKAKKSLCSFFLMLWQPPATNNLKPQPSYCSY